MDLPARSIVLARSWWNSACVFVYKCQRQFVWCMWRGGVCAGSRDRNLCCICTLTRSPWQNITWPHMTKPRDLSAVIQHDTHLCDEGWQLCRLQPVGIPPQVTATTTTLAPAATRHLSRLGATTAAAAVVVGYNEELTSWVLQLPVKHPVADHVKQRHTHLHACVYVWGGGGAGAAAANTGVSVSQGGAGGHRTQCSMHHGMQA